MSDIHISPDLALPDEAVTQTFGILAKRGMGKSYTAFVLVEEMLKRNHQVVLVDPVGVAWGLRSSADGEGPGLPIVILGGDHGDVPLPVSAGERIAEMVVEQRLSVVLDLSLFRKGEQTRFMTDFCETLYRRNRQALHLVLDEADTVAPQKPLDGTHRLLGAVEDLVRRGRARGIGVTLITQRPAVLNKNVLTQIEVLITLRLIAPQDRAAIDDWVRVHGTPEQREELMASLPSLAVGEAWIWSPGWLNLFQRVRIRRRETFDSSSTPKTGEVVIAPKRLASVDLDALRAAMADLVEQSTENDPKALRKRITELEAELLERPAPEPLRIEVPVLKAADVERLETLAAQLQTTAREIMESIGRVVPQELVDARCPIHGAYLPKDSPLPDPVRELVTTGANGRVEQPAPAPRAAAILAPEASGEFRISGPQQRVLNTLAEFEALGIRELPRSIVAVFSDASPRSSAFGNNLGALRTAALLDYPSRGAVALTGEGRLKAGPASAPRSLKALHDAWCSKVSGPQARIIRILIGVYPRQIARQQLAAAVSASATSSAFGNNLGHLRTLGVIDYPKQGYVAATKLLFPKGLQ